MLANIGVFKLLQNEYCKITQINFNENISVIN